MYVGMIINLQSRAGRGHMGPLKLDVYVLISKAIITPWLCINLV